MKDKLYQSEGFDCLRLLLSMAVIMLMEGSGLLKSMRTIHTFSSPSSVLTVVSASTSAPNCFSIFRDTGLEIRE
jgi:hypothetical protein